MLNPIAGPLLAVTILSLFYIALGNVTTGQHTTATTFAGNGTNVTCALCQPGYFTNSSTNCSSSVDSESCPAGSCVQTTECTACPAGTLQADSGGVNCTICKDGYVSSMGSTKCNPCSSGSMNSGDHSQCVPCPPAPDTYQGYKNPTIGGVCSTCDPGHYQPASDGIQCFRCPYGTYGASSGLTVCSACGVGTYNPSMGASSPDACLACPGGYYCPDDETATPLLCPSGSQCPSGSSQPASCGLLYQSDSGAAMCSKAYSFWIVIAVAVLLAIGLVAGLLSGIIYMIQRRTAPPEPPKKERLIPEPLSGPVYGGY